MSFIDGFFTFNIDLVNVERNIYKKLFLKIPKHPSESYEFLLSRVIAFAHSYERDLEFSQVLYNTEEPTIWKKDPIDGILSWTQIGAPSYKKLNRAIKQNNKAKFKIYFENKEEPSEFCYEFRAQKTKAFQKIDFHYIDEDFIEKLIPHISSRINWHLTFIDQSIYLIWDDLELEGEIRDIDIWKIYQREIDNYYPASN